MTRRRETLVDCLERAEILLPRKPIQADRCVAVLVTPGFEELLDDMLGSFYANSGCHDALVVVFAVGRSRAIDRLVKKYPVQVVRCRPLAGFDATTNSTLYSVARVIDAEKFLCLDADMVVFGDLTPIFAALDACPAESILACREGNARMFRDLGQAVRRLYGGRRKDIRRLLGEDRGESRYELVVNSGLYAGRRAALTALDRCIRTMHGAVAWVDEFPHIRFRNQFVFNLALAHLRCGIELSPVYNVQLAMQTADLMAKNGRIQARWRDREVRVLHCNGGGRPGHGVYRRLVARLTGSLGEAPAGTLSSPSG